MLGHIALLDSTSKELFSQHWNISSASYLVVLLFPVEGSSKLGSGHLGIPSFLGPIGVHRARTHFDAHMESELHLVCGPCTPGMFVSQEVAS